VAPDRVGQTVTLDLRVLVGRLDLRVQRERWDKEFMGRKEERGSPE